MTAIKRQSFISIHRDVNPAAATGTITIAEGNAADGDTVTIGDGLITSKVFEFQQDEEDVATPGAVFVQIGEDEFDTAANLAAAINSVGTLDATLNYAALGASAQRLSIYATSASETVTVTHILQGVVGNNTISKSGTNISVTGMASGVASALTTRRNHEHGSPTFLLTKQADGAIHFLDVLGRPVYAHSQNTELQALYEVLLKELGGSVLDPN